MVATDTLKKEAKMKITQSLVVLSVIAVSLRSVPGVAFAASVSPETAPATEQLSFSPPVYLTALLALVALVFVVVSIVLLVKYTAQKELICHNSACASNPSMLQEGNDHFDYRQLETPEELCGGYSEQSELVMQEAIQRLTAQAALTATPLSATTRRTLPSIAEPAAFTTPAALPRASEPVVLAAPAATPSPARPHLARHRRIPVPGESAPTPHIKLVPALKHARKRGVCVAPAVPVVFAPTPALDVPEELEFLLRKIG